MDKAQQVKYEPLEASPVKSFFVSMLTRDIKLEDAILDLLDNCVDGALRVKKGDGDKPYGGFRAEIEFNKDTFTISDNCGGIPWALHEYAFRLGRALDYPTDVPGSVGVYGIGMKRAIFKMGRSCLISTRSGTDEYAVEIFPKWLADEKDWKLPVRSAHRSEEGDGTTIIIGDLYPGISKRFYEDAKAFTSELVRMVETHYAFIIDKGLEVIINGDHVKPRPIKLIFDESSERGTIRPYIFKTKTEDDVEVFLAVGFTRRIPSQNELLDEQESKRYSSADAGWTILCNDRAVLYCDRSEMTGWGEANVPRYHTQFIAISGIVEFKSADAAKLPTTTTKRGVDATSSLYLQIKNKMREGMRIFTDYTNKWKGREEESKIHIQKGTRLSFDDIKTQAQRINLNPTARIPPGEQYKPALPLPKRLEPARRRISFVKDVVDIKAVAKHLGNVDMEPSEVGEKCFDLFLKEARE